MFERLTEMARRAVVLAQEEAGRMRHNYLGTEHLLLGLLREERGIAHETLTHLGLTLAKARRQVENIVGYGEEDLGKQVPFTPRSKKVVELSLREALQLRSNRIDTEHLLLGLACETEGVASRVLSDLRIDPEAVRREVLGRISDPEHASGRRLRRAYLGLESAVGDDRPANLRALRLALGALEGGSLLDILAKSKVYETTATGAEDESRSLLSCVLQVECRMPAAELLRYCQGVEATLAHAGGEDGAREGSAKVYLLMHEKEVVKEPHLNLPHPGTRHPHHLKALAEIASDLAVPAVTVKDLLASVETGDVAETNEEI